MFKLLHAFLCRLLGCSVPTRPCKRYCSCCGTPVPQPKQQWIITTTDCVITTEELHMDLNTEQSCIATVRPLTAGGNPARIDGSVVFASDNENVRFEQIDFLNTRIFGVTPGETEITATFDADLDLDEVRTLTFDGTITVKEAEADSADFSFGEATLVLTPVGEPQVEEPAPAEDPGEEVADDDSDDTAVDTSIDTETTDTSSGDATSTETDTSGNLGDPAGGDSAEGSGDSTSDEEDNSGR